MKDCFICFENILHGVKFGCKHEMCIYCFMKLETNLCPYCRFPMHETKLTHYSTHIPPLLKKICSSNDLFSYILLQIYHTDQQLFTFRQLIMDIKKWTIHPNIQRIYMHEIQVLYKFIHPEKTQLLIILFNILILSFLTRNDVYLVHVHPHSYTQVYVVIYPIFIICSSVFIGYYLYYLWEMKKLKRYNFKERCKIKIENIMTLSL
jgi:hypothetical protein